MRKARSIDTCAKGPTLVVVAVAVVDTSVDMAVMLVRRKYRPSDVGEEWSPAPRATFSRQLIGTDSIYVIETPPQRHTSSGFSKAITGLNARDGGASRRWRFGAARRLWRLAQTSASDYRFGPRSDSRRDLPNIQRRDIELYRSDDNAAKSIIREPRSYEITTRSCHPLEFNGQGQTTKDKRQKAKGNGRPAGKTAEDVATIVWPQRRRRARCHRSYRSHRNHKSSSTATLTTSVKNTQAIVCIADARQPCPA